MKKAILILLAPLALVACDPNVVDLRPMYRQQQMQQAMVQVDDPSVNLLVNSSLDFPFRAWEFRVADELRGELSAEEGRYGQYLYQGFYLDPGDYCLKITHTAQPDNTEYAFWQQTTPKINLSKKESLTFSAFVHGQSIDNGGAELAVEWDGGRKSVTVDKNTLLTYIHIDGLPVYPVNFVIPITPEIASSARTFTVKLMVQPGSKGDFYFDEIFLTLK